MNSGVRAKRLYFVDVDISKTERQSRIDADKTKLLLLDMIKRSDVENTTESHVWIRCSNSLLHRFVMKTKNLKVLLWSWTLLLLVGKYSSLRYVSVKDNLFDVYSEPALRSARPGPNRIQRMSTDVAKKEIQESDLHLKKKKKF